MMADEQERVMILMPAYNEEERIGAALDGLLSNGWRHILVIDDGSRDHTADVAASRGAEVLRFPLNRGQGAALSAGVRYVASEYSPDVIVTFDADGQHHPDEVGALVAPVLKGEADIVLGSRFLVPRSEIPVFRKCVLKAGVWFTRIVSNIPVTDTHNGFRALGRRAYRSLRLTQRRMEHASEIIDEVRRHKLVWREVPVTIAYPHTPGEKGQRSGNFLRMGLKYLLGKITV